jgi:hypothetical protein
MEKLYKELLDREIYLKSLEKNSENNGRIQENQLCIIRVQQLLLKDIKNVDNNR